MSQGDFFFFIKLIPSSPRSGELEVLAQLIPNKLDVQQVLMD